MSKGGHVRKNVPAVTTKIDLAIVEKAARRPKRSPMSKIKQRLFLQEYAKCFNITKCAHKIGVSRQAIYTTLDLDEEFKQKFQEVKNGILDTIEETSVYVSLQKDARGFNDRKLLLQAHRPEVYNPKTQIEINQQVTIKTAPNFVKQAFQGIGLVGTEIADAEVIELDETDLQTENKQNTKQLGDGKAK